MSRIDVILPTYNHAKFLSRAIDNILNQKFSDFQLIIVNDGSTDNTTDILNEYKDERILIINNERNMKLPASLNIGHAAGVSPYCTWVSDDNVSMNNHLLLLYAKILDGGYDFVQGRYIIVEMDGSETMHNIQTHKDNWGYGNLCPCFLYKRLVWDMYKYDPSMEFLEDLKFYLQAFLHPYKFGYIDEYLVKYYRHTQSMTSTGCPDYWEKRNRLYNDVIAKARA